MEEQNEIKQAYAKDRATHCRCPECLHIFIPEETDNGSAICPKCSKEVPKGNDFTLFYCSNCNQLNAWNHVNTVVACNKCSSLIVDFLPK